MGAKGNNGLAFPVVFLNEGVNSHRHVAPPIGITEVHYIIFFNFYIALYFRTCAGFLFLLCLFHAWRVFCRIRFYRDDVEEFATGLLGNHFRHDVRVPFLDMTYIIILIGSRKESHQYFFILHILFYFIVALSIRHWAQTYQQCPDDQCDCFHFIIYFFITHIKSLTFLHIRYVHFYFFYSLHN